MLRDGDKPRVGPTKKKTLGAQPGNGRHDDIAPDENGNVVPGTGGMSVSPNWRNLPFFLIPKRLNSIIDKARGSNALCCWKMGDGQFASGSISDTLVLRKDRETRGLVEPSRKMHLDQFQNALAETRPDWELDES
jgi:hypothetical protein